jgi:hypothetical protein
LAVVRYVWLALFLAGWPKPLWRWIKRQRASIWPTDSSEIQPASVGESKRFFISTTPWDGSQTYVAAICSCDKHDQEVGLWQNRACRAPGTRFGFSFRYDYRFSEQLQFVGRDCA